MDEFIHFNIIFTLKIITNKEINSEICFFGRIIIIVITFNNSFTKVNENELKMKYLNKWMNLVKLTTQQL